ncbi:protein YoaL [Enterobacter hormaechei subsp. xiangfangensis]|uniref:protein YoaL n=2 Tax=Enterobacter hormaechei TaxID=158836 RepID=UPI00092F7FFB
MFSVRLIIQEYRATAHYMDRHRRQSSSRPLRALITGDLRHASTLIPFEMPDISGAPFCHSFSRSVSWNS